MSTWLPVLRRAGPHLVRVVHAGPDVLWTLQGLSHVCVSAGMSLAPVTLASALQAGGKAL